MSSPDGIRWDDSNWVNPITTRGLEGPHNVVFDNKYKKYRAYSTFRDSKIDPLSHSELITNCPSTSDKEEGSSMKVNLGSD